MNDQDLKSRSAFSMNFITRSYQRDGYEAVFTYATQSLGNNSNKIVIRFTNVSKNDKELVATALAKTIMQIKPAGCIVQAGDDQLMRGQWSFVVSFIPDVRLVSTLDMLLTTIDKTYGK
jgi:hypothetical protein